MDTYEEVILGKEIQDGKTKIILRRIQTGSGPASGDRGERPVAEVAKGLGVSPSQLYQWQQRYADVAKTAINGRGETKDEELKRLRRENAILRKEKDVLKKSIFVRDIER